TALSLPPSSLSLLLSVPLSNPHLMECIRGESCDQRRVSQNPLCFFLQLPLLAHTQTHTHTLPLHHHTHTHTHTHTHPHTHTHTHKVNPLLAFMGNVTRAHTHTHSVKHT